MLGRACADAPALVQIRSVAAPSSAQAARRWVCRCSAFMALKESVGPRDVLTKAGQSGRVIGSRQQRPLRLDYVSVSGVSGDRSLALLAARERLVDDDLAALLEELVGPIEDRRHV